MTGLPPLRSKDYHQIDDALHEALGVLEDFRLGSWWLRCIEFHFGKGIFRAGDHFGWHLHKEIQIEIPLRGRFVFWAKGGKQLRVEPGAVCVIPPGVEHRWKAEADGIMIGLLLALVPRAHSLDTPLRGAVQMITFSPPALEIALEGLISEFVNPPPENEFSLKRKSSWIFLLTTRILGMISVPDDSFGNENQDKRPSFRRERVVSKIIRYIDANIEGELTMERIETVVGLSSRQIHRLFIEVTGGSCHRYIMDRRLEIARSKLQNDPTLSIKEIAYASGFASPAHFSAKFKKNFGVPPTEYR